MKKSMFRVPEIFGVFVGLGFLWGFWRGFLLLIWLGVFGIDILIYMVGFW
jgi:hypothetical protein